MYKLTVQKEKCNACGMCSLDCSILQEDSSGKVEVIGKGIVSDSEIGKIRNIIELCPTEALHLIEDSANILERLEELKNKMKAPLKFNPPSLDEYAFRLEDKNEYAELLWKNSRGGVSDEYEFDYKSAGAARSAGEKAFRDEIYSQASALAQQVIAMYEQRKMNKVARYAEIPSNYKYSVHQRLIKDLRAYVNEIESYIGKKLSLPSDFFIFRTKDTDYIDRRQEKANDWLANRIKESLESPSEFYSCVKTDKTSEYVTVSSWFGSDKEKLVYKYAYYIDADGLKRFYNHVVRATWKSGKYTKQDCEREIDAFHRAIEQEWKNKIEYLLKNLR